MSRIEIVIVVSVLGCGPGRPVPDGDVSGASGVSESSESATSEVSETDSLVCEEGLIPCDGECIWAVTNENCGSCGHVCHPFADTGMCSEEGRCTAVLSECLTPDLGFTTCREYCTSIGELCGYGREFEGHPCNSEIPVSEFEHCTGTTAHIKGDIPAESCDLPIPWGETVASLVVNSARCCCSQYGGE